MTLRVYLAPGASGTVEALRPQLEGLARRGFEATAVALPRGRAERAVPAYAAAVRDPSIAVVGGHSFGGRVASLLAAAQPVAGLLLFSYPLHRPGHPEQWEERTAHWERIACPVLLLSGASDPFARIAILRRAVRRLPQAELVTYPGVGHGVRPVLDDALDRAAAWLAGLPG